MKKVLSALSKVVGLLFSFSAIALVILLRDQINLGISILTIVVALFVIVIIIMLLINEPPSDMGDTVKQVKPVRPVVQEHVKLEKTPVYQEEITEEYEELVITKPKRKRGFIQRMENGDFVFGAKDLEVEEIYEEDLPQVLKTRSTPVRNIPVIEDLPNPYPIDLKMNDTDLENLMSLMEAMEANFLINRNADFDNSDLLPQGVKYYQYEMRDIPVVSMIRQANKKVKVMAGIQSNHLYQLCEFEADEAEVIYHLYQSSNHIQALIQGGRYRLFDIETQEKTEVSEPYRVQVRIYHR